jgi:Protein of unknown function (DUF2442)
MAARFTKYLIFCRHAMLPSAAVGDQQALGLSAPLRQHALEILRDRAPQLALAARMVARQRRQVGGDCRALERELAAPLAWFPRLAEATDEQRRNWRLIGRGHGIHWPDVDEDISVESLLRAS